MQRPARSELEAALRRLTDPRTILPKEYRRNSRGDLTDRRQLRNSDAPAGVCESCWRHRRSDTHPGTLFITGPRLIVACPRCVTAMGRLNVALHPLLDSDGSVDSSV